MISEFQDLADKIDRLAELTDSLRRENADLRRLNSILIKDNLDYATRFAQAQQRVQDLLAQLPPEAGAAPDAASADTQQQTGAAQ
jgi:DNA repair exonuclease SbcCD ATPase subunit